MISEVRGYFHNIETGQLICTKTQSTGFYKMGVLLNLLNQSVLSNKTKYSILEKLSNFSL